MEKDSIKLFLVDDDVVYMKALEIEFKQKAGLLVETYTSGEDCIKKLENKPNLIILDYQLGGADKTALDGLQTLDKVKILNPNIPVVMLSGQDKIEVAIKCMHHKAFDYVVKNETAFVHLQKILTSVLHYHKLEKEIRLYMRKD